MGMYTEIYFNAKLKENLDENVVTALKIMIGEVDSTAFNNPEHELFSKPRWSHLFNSSSYYHIPFTTVGFKYNDISECWYITARADLKNYDSEIELFFDWIKPYVDSCGDGKTFIGYSRYEDDEDPVLYYA